MSFMMTTYEIDYDETIIPRLKEMYPDILNIAEEPLLEASQICCEKYSDFDLWSIAYMCNKEGYMAIFSNVNYVDQLLILLIQMSMNLNDMFRKSDMFYKCWNKTLIFFNSNQSHKKHRPLEDLSKFADINNKQKKSCRTKNGIKLCDIAEKICDMIEDDD